MTVTFSVLQRIKLGVMLGAHRCEDIKSMTEFSDLYKIIKASQKDIEEHTFVAGQELMIKAEQATTTTSELVLEPAQVTLLRKFVTEYKHGWTVSDADWVQALMVQL